MKLAIMQPYVFPYLGYLQLIYYADKFVVFDDTQFVSKGWVNRNRILHPNQAKGWQYFTVPVKKHSRDASIIDVEINDSTDWRKEFFGKLTSYKKKAPFYHETVDFLRDCLSHDASSVDMLAVHTLKATCELIDIPFDYTLFSEMDVDTSDVQHAGQWALKISDSIGASEYVNPHGGYLIFKEAEFRAKGIELRFLVPELPPYSQRRGTFEPNLSIVDVLMWHDRSRIRELLENFSIVSQENLCKDGKDGSNACL